MPALARAIDTCSERGTDVKELLPISRRRRLRRVQEVIANQNIGQIESRRNLVQNRLGFQVFFMCGDHFVVDGPCPPHGAKSEQRDQRDHDAEPDAEDQPGAFHAIPPAYCGFRANLVARSYGPTRRAGVPSGQAHMTIVFTDLDGTLLDDENYSWEAARPALEELRRRGIPCVLVTSKTRAEVEFWRNLMENSDPFIVENGAAVFIPKGYFPFQIPGAITRGKFEVLEWGTPYGVLIAALEEASRSARCKVVGFHQMTAQAVSEACGMPLDQAVLAKQREYDEPFRIVEPARADALLSELEARGLHWTEGGRFHHVCGPNDKALLRRP